VTTLEAILMVATGVLGVGWLRAHAEAVAAQSERDDAILQLRALTASYGKRVDSRSAVR
jgi:hypothetical protein